MYMICIYTYIKYIYIKCILYITLKVDRLGHHTPRFWCVEAKFQGESIYDNFEDGDHQRTKEKHRGTTDGCISQLFQILFLEENN